MSLALPVLNCRTSFQFIVLAQDRSTSSLLTRQKMSRIEGGQRTILALSGGLGLTIPTAEDIKARLTDDSPMAIWGTSQVFRDWAPSGVSFSAKEP